MAVITLTRGTYSGAKDLAEYTAEHLGYKLLAREDIIDELAEYGWAEDKLDKARFKKLGILQRMNLEWIHYTACMRAVLTKHAIGESLVYHGNKGQLVLKGFPHVLSINVIADMEYRIKAIMARNEYAIDRKEAIRILNRIDERRDKWSKFLYQSNMNDATSFDMVIDLSRKSLPDAYEMIQSTVMLPQFQSTDESRKQIENLCRAAELRAKIAMEADVIDDDIEIEVNDGVANIKGTVHSLEDADAIRNLLRQQPEIEDIETVFEAPPQEYVHAGHADLTE